MKKQHDMNSWHIDLIRWDVDAKTNKYSERKEVTLYSGFKTIEEALDKLNWIEKEAEKRIVAKVMVKDNTHPDNGFTFHPLPTLLHVHFYDYGFVFKIKEPQ